MNDLEGQTLFYEIYLKKNKDLNVILKNITIKIKNLDQWN